MKRVKRLPADRIVTWMSSWLVSSGGLLAGHVTFYTIYRDIVTSWVSGSGHRMLLTDH